MMKTQKKQFSKVVRYVVLSIAGIIMIYPLIWMFFATFKSTTEIFSSTKLLPSKYSFDAYIKGWVGVGGDTNFTDFFLNSFQLAIPVVILTVLSSMVVAYGFARFQFTGKKILFTLMIGTLMLPDAVIVVPRYLLFNKLGWLNTYLPFWVPAALACNAFFTYMLVQFLRGIPKSLDESAKIDGCGPVGILVRILMPLMKPALFSAGLLQLITIWNDFFDPLIMINSVNKYPLALGLRMSIDSSGATVAWEQIMAMSLLTILPLIILFFSAQRYFIEGIATTGLKG